MTVNLPLIYCAVDTGNLVKAIQIAKDVSGAGCGIKLGLEFFVGQGPAGVKAIQNACPNMSIFLDLKFHDIPNTVAGAMRSAVAMGVDFVNVHATGGAEMMMLAQKTLEIEAAKAGVTPPKLLAVTVLTSMNDAGLTQVGQTVPAASQVLRLAKLTKECGLAGVVCSAEEIALIRTELGSDFILMVPGIRPAGAAMGDQKRVMTPPDAIKIGATHLVIGRPITESPNPAAAASEILASI